jgi:hypothetical protein
MEYEWEKKKKITDAIERAMIAADLHLPNGFRLGGLAIINSEDVEAAYISAMEPDNDIATMDIMGDIAGDANRIYEACFSIKSDDDVIVMAALDKMLESVNGK